MNTIEKKLGEPGYINKNCWLANSLGYPPSKHCQYCELKLQNCLFSRYLVMSIILVILIFGTALYVEKGISKTLIVSVFGLVIAYGYYFDKSTQKIIESSFAQRKAKEELEKLTLELEDKVNQRTKDLKDAYAKLKKLDETKDDFLATVQHQLRTPLSGIKWLVETLQKKIFGKLSKKQKEYVDNIHEMNERMIRLVSDMLNIVSIESEVSAIKKEVISLCDFCHIFTGLLEAPAKSRGVKIHTSCTDKCKIKIETNEQALKTILECFASNAINYSSPGQEVVLSVKENDNEVIFSVKDEGIGIPPEEQKRIFERFYRAPNAKNFKPDGTGLGLYIASMLCERIGGKVYFESEKNNGTTFYLSVPKIKN